MFFLIVFVFCSHVIFGHSAIIKPLNDLNWNVIGEYQGLQQIKIATQIPTGMYSDLINANILENDFKDQLNGEEYTWISETKWTYSLEFFVEKDILKAPYVELTFHGLDGITKILFNGEEIGKTTNSFVRYRFNIKNKIQPNNHLEIIFDPVMNSKNKENVRFKRKMQASFGTEWSPKVPSVGIWKEVELIAYDKNDIIIRDITTKINGKAASKFWTINIDAHCDVPLNISKDIKGKIELNLFLENGNIIRENIPVEIIEGSPEKVKINTVLKIERKVHDIGENFKLWWPNGYGDQNLYNLTLKFFNSSTKSYSTKSIRIGFREIILEKDLLIAYIIPENGYEFGFKVNDVLINSKGANFLPIDILPEKTSNKETIKSLLLAAKMANMNMLRIPAVGLYQSDYFYELCDEYGILVWQDMMFYEELRPVISYNDSYLASIKTEISQQIIRLQYHPSIALWVLSSDVMLTVDKITDLTERNSRTKDLKHYHYLFRKIIENEDIRHRQPLISSPSDGSEYSSYDFVVTKPNNFKMGDVHYSLNGNSWLVDSESIPKFITQYGLRSFPFAVLNTSKLANIKKDFVNLSLDRENPNIDILCSVAYHFGIPKAGNLENFIYASQINQAWSLKVQTEWFRRWKNNYFKMHLSGDTNGTLLWHLNDVWEAPTSSLIEYGGKWKMVQYYARNFFDPLSSYAEITESGDITVYLLSDLKKELTIDVKIEIFKWISLKPIYTHTEKSQFLQNSKTIQFSVIISDLKILKDECETSIINKKCFLKITFINNEDLEVHHNYFLPAVVSFKDIADLSNPDIQTIVNCNYKRCTVVVKTNAIALFVWLDTGSISGYFSDNGFIMTEEQKIITFYAEKEISALELQMELNIKVMDKDRLDKFDYPPDDFQTNLCKDYNI